MPTENPLEFEVEVTAQDAMPEDLDGMTRNLLRELRETDVESVKLLAVGSAPKGTKAGESITIGMLAIEVLPSVLPSVIGLIQGWVTRGQGRTVKFKGRGIEFEGPPEELYRLLATLEKGKEPE